MAKRDYYEVLGVERGANIKERGAKNEGGHFSRASLQRVSEPQQKQAVRIH